MEGLSNYDAATVLLQALPIPKTVNAKTVGRGSGPGWQFMAPLQGNPLAIREFTSLHRNDDFFEISKEADNESRYRCAQQVYQRHILGEQDDGSGGGAGVSLGSTTNGYFESPSLQSSFAIALSLSEPNDTMDGESTKKENSAKLRADQEEMSVRNKSLFGNCNDSPDVSMATQNDDYGVETSGYDVAEYSVDEYDVSEYNISEYKSIYNAQLPPRPPQSQPRQGSTPLSNDLKRPSHLSRQQMGTDPAAAEVARSRATMWLRQPLLDHWRGISTPSPPIYCDFNLF